MDNPHEKMMRLALAEAEKAGQNQEVPIGAVLVSAAGDILAKACNQTIGRADPTGHAEILAMRAAAQKIKNYRLLNTTLYVTVEPCVMCMGALIHSRVATLVFGAFDPKGGAAGSLYNFAADMRFNHRIEIIQGSCEAECGTLIQDFFRQKRNL
jgi:tRNA(adenine34) deaminase